jgi:two-component system invasion response regulator UvrY
MLKILIVDDHAIIRQGLTQILLKEYPDARIEEANDTELAIQKTQTDEFDIIISDLTMPGRSGLELVHHAKQHCPKTPVLILSIQPEELYAIRALKAGAAGYITKDAATKELIEAVKKALQGRRYISPAIAEKIADELDKNVEDRPAHELLSDREFEVFKLLAQGQTISDISAKFLISISTVSTYRARVMIKMGLRTNVELTRYALSNKLI